MGRRRKGRCGGGAGCRGFGGRCRPLGALLLAGLVLAPLAAFAQPRGPEATGGGRIEGRVVHAARGVPGVVVHLAELNRIEISGAEGEFVFTALPAGGYTLQLTLGENSLTRENVLVLAGETHRLEIEVDWEIGREIGLQEKVTVTAGAARAAKIVDAPAAVTSIPEEQIEREAATGQVPKVLEFTPGAEVTQSGLYDFNFNTRGFNSSLNRRVSTYIDGRDVGVVLLGAQEWPAIAGGLNDMASLEFIRGPSAALYGANASSGVINITTKAPRDSQGTQVNVTAGDLDTLSVDLRRAAPIGRGWYYKLTAGAKASGDFTVSRNPDGPDSVPGTADDLPQPEYSEFCMLIGERDCLPTEKTLFREQDNDIVFGSLRLDKYLGDDGLLTFEAGATDIEGPVFQTGIGRVQNIDSQRPFYRFAFAAPRWNVLAHHTRREGHQVNLTKDLRVNFDLDTDDTRYGAEAQGHWNFFGEKMRLVVGGAYTEERVDTADQDTGLQTVVYRPIETDRQALFSQFDWKVGDHFKVVFAGRVDWNTLHETQFSPKAAAVYSVNRNHSMRFTFNKAFQVANYSEFFLHTRIAAFPMGGFVRTICVALGQNPPPQPPTVTPIDCGIPPNDEAGDPTFIPILAVGNDDLELEKTAQWEVGYSGLIANRAFITVDYYNSENKNFITDLVPQVGTSLGSCLPSDPVQDPTICPINRDYLEWVSTVEAETTIQAPHINPMLTVAQALRNAVENSVGGSTLGFRLAQDLDGSPVIVGRTYTNVGSVDTQGVDLAVQYFFNNQWNLQASYSWFDFEILDRNQDVEDILLPNTPEHKASLSLSFRRKRWVASASGRWVDAFRWAAGVFQGDVPAYATEDIALGYSFNDSVALSVNVANVRDNVHRQTFGGDLLSRRALGTLSYSWGQRPE